MAVKLDDASVKDDDKSVTFVAYCIDCYKTIHGIKRGIIFNNRSHSMKGQGHE